MKTKHYLFRFAVAFTAFIFGIFFFNAWQYISSAAQETETEIATIQPVSQPEIAAVPPPVAEMTIIETTSATDLDENVEYQFDGSGDYYITGDLTKYFTDVEQITIITHDYTNASEENNYQGTLIPPKGSIWAKKEYKFARINIANKQISFETQARKGISYKFVGKFVDYNQCSQEEYADLEGRLIKMLNGKRVAESEVRLVLIEGC
jgi:hypothetical protein